jgi:hypothetical protein
MPLLIYSSLETDEIAMRGGVAMAVRRARKKAVKKKVSKAKKKVTARKKAVKKKVSKAKPKARKRPRYTCVLCGVEVAVSKEGLGISRLLCCGHPMRKK